MAHINIHNITHIEVDRHQNSGHRDGWFTLMTTDKDGAKTEITLFYRKQPEIEGAELLNLMQAVEA